MNSTQAGNRIRPDRRSSLLSFGAFLVLGLAFPWRAAGVSLSVSPSTLPWSTNTWVSFTITNLVPHSTVDLKLYADIDHSASVTPPDVQIMQFRLVEGQTGSLSTNIIVGDLDGATNGVLSGHISYHGATDLAQFWHASGNYLWQVCDTNGTPLCTTALTVTPANASTWITGQVRVMTDTSLTPEGSAPLAGALVILEAFAPAESKLPSTWSDTNGNFTLCLPTKLSLDNIASLTALKPGYLTAGTDPGNQPMSATSFTNVLSSGTNQLSRPLYLAPPFPPFLATVSGTLQDESGMPIPGEILFIQPGSKDGGSAMSVAVSDTNGQYSLLWPTDDSSGPQISATSPTLNMRGLVGTIQSLNTVTSDISGLIVTCPRADTLVTGKVRDPFSNGLSGAAVTIQGDAGISAGYVIGSNGRYELCYRSGSNASVQVDPRSVAFLHQVCLTSEVAGITAPASVNFNTVTGLLVEGHVYDLASQPLVLDQTSVSATSGSLNYQDNLTPSSAGIFRFLLPSSLFDLMTQGFSRYGYSDAGTNVVVSSDLTGVDLFLGQGASISGTVRGGGVPLTNVHVDVGTIVTNGQGNWSWNAVNGADVDSNGDYSIYVPAGSNYLAQAWPTDSQPWASQYYSNATDISQAQLIQTTTGTPATHIDFNLSRGGRFSGSIYAGGSLLSNANMEVGITTGGGSSWNHISGIWSKDGSYSLVVPPGTGYILRAWAPEGSPWLAQYFSNTMDLASATRFTIQADDQLTGLDFHLAPGLSLAGHVTDLAGHGLSNLFVSVMHQYSNSSDWVNGSSTGTGGDFIVYVPSGTNYSVSIWDSPQWIGQYYNHSRDMSSAALLTVTSSLSGINFTLTPGMAIAGRVTAGTGAPLNTGVEVGYLDGTNWVSEWSTWSDTNGLYSLTAAAASNHIVRIANMPYHEVFHHNRLSAFSADTVSAMQGVTVSNIDFTLYGDTTDSDGDGVPDYLEAYVFGTSPYNSNDVLRCTAMALSNGLPIISWAGVNGKGYVIERSSHLTDPSAWTNVTPGGVTGSGTQRSFTDSNAPAGSIYRIGVPY